MKTKLSIIIALLIGMSASATTISWNSADLTGQITGVQAGWIVALYEDVDKDGWDATSILFSTGATDSDDTLLNVTTFLSSGKAGTIWGDSFSAPSGDMATSDNLVSVVFNAATIAGATEYWYTSAFTTINGTTGAGGSYQLPGSDILDTYTTISVVPEPATAMLLALGGGLAWLVRMKQRMG